MLHLENKLLTLSNHGDIAPIETQLSPTISIFMLRVVNFVPLLFSSVHLVRSMVRSSPGILVGTGLGFGLWIGR